MQDTGFFYIVRWWVAPTAEARLLEWMKGGHIAEVVAQPGMRWARCIKLNEVDALGWPAYANVYGLDSGAALEAYFRLPIHEKFARERAAFADVLRTERASGPVVLSAAK
jgi:hypothetical protein